MLEQIETTVSTLPTRPDPLHKQAKNCNATDSLTTPNHVTTKNLNSNLTPGNKRKLDVSKPTTQHNVATNTQPILTQQTILDSYKNLLWYNSPAIAHKFFFEHNKKATCTIALSTQSNMKFDIPNFTALDDDTYFELASLLNRKCCTQVTKEHLGDVDYKLAEERDSRATIEPNAKRIKNEQLPGTFYAKIAKAISTTNVMVVAMDMTLQNYRAQEHLSKLQTAHNELLAVDLTDETDKSVIETLPELVNKGVVIPDKKRAATDATLPEKVDNGVVVTDKKRAATVNENPHLQAFALELMSEVRSEMDARLANNVTPNDKPIDPAPAPVKKPTVNRRLYQLFDWDGIGTHSLNHRISNAQAMNTFKTVFPNMKPEPPLLSCKPRNNPRASLEAALAFVGAAVPTQWLNKVFQPDYTKQDKPISVIFKRNNAAERFAYKDYDTAVIEHGLSPGIADCFKGQNGGNFAGEGCFTTTAPLLCQMEIKGNQVQSIKGKVYQWLIYIPHMNVVVSCNNHKPPGFTVLTKQKNVWILGKKTIKALTEEDKSSIDKLLGKLAFPAKDDNAKNLRLHSAVWIQNINSNFNLVDEVNED
jgi:hypothetical protein